MTTETIDASARSAMTIHRAVVAVVAASAFLVVIAVPTDLIDTPWFSREIPPTWWSWPSMVVTAVLAGLLAATYVNPRSANSQIEGRDDGRRHGIAGGLLTFFAVGCPVCNKLVLIALGSAGAMTWFAPLQPLLVVAGIAALGWALRTLIVGQRECPVDAARSGP